MEYGLSSEDVDKIVMATFPLCSNILQINEWIINTANNNEYSHYFSLITFSCQASL